METKYLQEFENHLKYASGGVAKLTVINYCSDVQQFLKWHTDSPLEATKSTIMQYNKFMLEEQGLAKQSVNRKLVSLRNFFDYLSDEYDLKQNPLNGIKNFRVEQKASAEKDKKVLSVQQVKKLLLAANSRTNIGIRDKAILYLLYETGLRRDECRRLEVADLDPALNCVNVRPEVGKGGRERKIPIMSKITKGILREYLQNARPKLPNGKTSPCLFLSKYGGFISSTSMGELVSKYALKADLEQITCHMLRHSLATHLLANGVLPPVIQKILGHVRLSTTEIYLHVDTPILRSELSTKHPLV